VRFSMAVPNKPCPPSSRVSDAPPAKVLEGIAVWNPCFAPRLPRNLPEPVTLPIVAATGATRAALNRAALAATSRLACFSGTP